MDESTITHIRVRLSCFGGLFFFGLNDSNVHVDGLLIAQNMVTVRTYINQPSPTRTEIKHAHRPAKKPVAFWTIDHHRIVFSGSLNNRTNSAGGNGAFRTPHHWNFFQVVPPQVENQGKTAKQRRNKEAHIKEPL
jgi:hypothetical protein